jgi:hypothetical protein
MSLDLRGAIWGLYLEAEKKVGFCLLCPLRASRPGRDPLL